MKTKLNRSKRHCLRTRVARPSPTVFEYPQNYQLAILIHEKIHYKKFQK